MERPGTDRGLTEPARPRNETASRLADVRLGFVQPHRRCSLPAIRLLRRVGPRQEADHMDKVRYRRATIAIAMVVALATIAAPAAASAGTATVPHYDHIALIVEENHGFDDIIGNPNAPNLNRLANTYGLATQYFGTSDPSAPNYVAMLAGS